MTLIRLWRKVRDWANEPPKPPPPPDPKPEPEPSKKNWLAIVGLAVAIASGIGTYLAVPGVLEGSDADEGDRSAKNVVAKLRVDQFIVSNGPEEVATMGGRMVHPKESVPTLDFTVVNTGDGPATITSAKARIADYADLEPCFTQGGGGDVPVDVFYTMELPAKPLPGERDVSTKAFAFSVGPGETQRFEVHLSGPGGIEEPHLYLLDVTLETKGGSGSLKPGRALVATPGSVPRTDTYLPEDGAGFDGQNGDRRDGLAILWCYARNLAEVQRLTGAPGVRASDELAALRSVEPAPSFQRRLAAVSPARAARQLLSGDDPSLSVFAAEASGDDALVREMRTAAVREFERRGQKALDEDQPGRAAFLARQGLEVLGTDTLTSILRTGERRFREAQQADEDQG